MLGARRAVSQTFNERESVKVKDVGTLLLILAAVFLSQASCADPDTGSEKSVGDNFVRLQYATSSEPDFQTAILGDYKWSPEHNYLIGGSYGRRISDTLFGKPLQSTANVGVQYFNERGLQDDGYGVTAYYKLHYLWRLPWTQTRVRLGLGEGLSYVTRIPLNEVRDFAKKHNAESAKLMNHLEWTVDLPLRQFKPMESLFNGRIKELNVGFVVWHRSSVYGVFAETRGGSNFMGLGFEAQY